MALSDYDKQFLNQDDQKRISALTESYNKAVASGNQGLADSYHTQAEQIRASGNRYSGGADGSTYAYLGQDTSGQNAYTPSTLRQPELQESYINDMYKQQQEAAKAALKAAYDQNVIDLNATAEKIPANYQAARNQVSGNAAVERANFNEYAAASGLNSGAGGQAQLAMGNQLQANMSALSQSEADALSDIETQRAKLNAQYQNDIAQAMINGDLQRAQALYQEHVRVDEALTSLSQAQADENYRAWGANYQLDQTNKEFARSQVDAILAAGGTPSEALLASAGYDPNYISAMQSYYAPKYSGYSSGGGSGGGGGGTTKFTALANMLGYQMNNTATEKTGVATSYGAFKDAVNNAYTRGEITKAEKSDLLNNAKLVKYWGIE